MVHFRLKPLHLLPSQRPLALPTQKVKKYEEELTEITKLQDALLVLNKINASMELVLLVKKRLKKLNQTKNNLF